MGAIAFVGGTLVGAPPLALALFAAAGMVGAVLLARLRVSALPAVMVLAFALGGARVAVGDDAPLTAYAGPRVQQVEGIVVSDVDGYGDFSRFRLRVERVRSSGADSANSANWTDANGTLLVSARADAEIAKQRDAPYFRYGDRLLLRGRINEPPELDDFDYAAYLARQGISEVMDSRSVTIIGTGEGSAFYRSLYDVRRRLAQSHRGGGAGASGGVEPGYAAWTATQHAVRPDGKISGAAARRTYWQYPGCMWVYCSV